MERGAFSRDYIRRLYLGKGAIDDKGMVVSILEAVESLLEAGYQPEQTVYLAFGGDEERGGYLGAAQIADTLEARGVEASLVLDEGLFVGDGFVPGVGKPVALIGVAEKGAASVRISATAEGGHASMPGAETAIGTLSRAIERIMENPLPATLEGVPSSMFARAGSEMGFMQRLVFSNLWLFNGILIGQLEKSASTNALIRTTVAPTILEAGTKVNVLPPLATAIINIRLRPGDSIDGTVSRLRSLIDDDRVELTVLEGASEPSAISSTESPAFRLIADQILVSYPQAIAAPALMIARTDSRHYSAISSSICKISPVLLDGPDSKRIHGVNERISLENLENAIRFYRNVLVGASEMSPQ